MRDSIPNRERVGLADAYHVAQWVAAVAFGLVGLAAVVDWARYRGRGRAALAVALGSLGAVSLLGQVTAHVGALQVVVTFITIPLFLASGYGLLLFRHELIPYRRVVFRTATVLVILTALVFIALLAVAQPLKPNEVSPGLLAAVLLFLVVWGACVGQPAVSLAIASRGRPAVQRARIRSLSAAYGAIILVLIVDIVVGSFSGFKANANLGFQFATELVVLATAPLMYFSFSPPALLRQVWRAREEEPLRRSLEDLLLSTTDRSELARKSLEWAIRLVGAEGGLIADSGSLLATNGVEAERAQNLRRAALQLSEGGTLAPQGSGAAYAVPLSLADGRGALVLVSGPFTPLFGADEYGRMEAYAVSLAAAMDRAALFGELRRNQATLEQRVAQRTAELEAANEELEAFSYTVSHDLRQPLRALDGFSRALNDTLDPAQLGEQGRHYLDAISRNAQQMGRLIDALLGFSRLSRQPVQRTLISPTPIAHRVADSLREQANGQAPTISIADLPPCQADPTLLEEVFGNLIGNAVKFSSRRPDAAVEVGWRQEGGEVVYYVRDNGAGFDMKYADKLFGVFQRLHSQRDFEGTGAGLAIVQRIVHRHGGRIWAEGAVGEGATFYFTLEGIV